jgi:uncharacterized membrane protein
MEETRSTWTDERIELIMGNLLRAGVLTAAAVMFLGGIVYLLQYGRTKPHMRVFHGEDPEFCSVAGILADARTLESRGIIQFGLLLLIATPIARVIFSAAAFALQRDYLYVVITLFVLGVLAYSLLGSDP